MSDWIEEYFADVDAMRLDAFVERHTDDAVVTFQPFVDCVEQKKTPLAGRVSPLERAACGRSTRRRWRVAAAKYRDAA